MRCVPGARGLDPLLDYLKYEGVLAESPAPASPVEVLVGALPSVACCGSRFGRGHGRALREAGPLGPAAACDRGRPGREPRRDRRCRVLVGGEQSAQRRFDQRPAAELQALLKFLYVAGLAPQPLVTLVPPVAGWHDTGVPKANPAADVQRLLDSCDRTNPIGVSGCRRGPACHGVQPDRLHPRHRNFAAA